MDCYNHYTGGRVTAIIKEARQKNGKKATLPSSRKDDKISKFNEDYKNHIDVQGAYEEFAYNWEIQKEINGDNYNDGKRKMPMIAKALIASFSSDLWKAVVAKLIWGILLIFSIWFFVFGVLDYIKLKKEKKATRQDQDYTLILCGFFFLTMFTLSVAIQQMADYSSDLGSRVKAALTTAIYKKMITREGHGSEADVVSLVAKDAEKLAEACLSLQYLWSGIFETVIVLVVVTILMGIITILPGIGLILIFLPLQYCLGLTVAYGKKKLATVSNHRIMMMEEILRGIKLIKIYGWEMSFFEKLTKIRDEEGAMRNTVSHYQAAILGLVFCLPPLLSMVIFGTAELTGEVKAVLTFTVLSFFNTLRVPFSKLPKSLRDVLDGMSCFERIESFLLEPDLLLSIKDAKAGGDEGILLDSVSVSYGHGAAIVLSNVNLKVPKGSLMMVAGPVASGKSNLLKTMLGELTVVQGTSFTSPSKAYVPQTPWTALGTVRENIVFGNEFDEVHYKKVIHACALEPDLAMMADGDQTWIGERGGNLSGGQKQRIALARAAYSRADLFILDSPLSAVDMYTCQHIFKYCIEDIMLVGGGTVVLATHQTELFSKSDHLVVMKEGNLAYNAAYSFQGIKHLFPNFHDETDGKAVKKEEEKIEKKTKQRVRKIDPSIVAAKPVVAKAVKNVGAYSWYATKMGVSLAATGTLIFIIGQIIRVYGDVWISVWTTRKFAKDGYTSDAFYVGLYVMLVFVFLSLSFTRAFYWLWAGKVAANKIHDESFAAALKAPMHFFHVTPIGELLSFFSKDIDTIDDVLVDNMCLFQIFFWILILALGLVSYNLPFFLVIVAGITILYVYVVRIFIIASMPLKAEYGESISHVIAHTAETESGLAVVRAFRMEERFVKENLKFQERSTLSAYAVSQLSLWLAFRVDIIGAFMVLTCCLLAVMSNGLEPAVAGLIVSNSFQILLFFSIMSRTLGEIHGNMGAVDRAMKMIDLEHETEPVKEVKLLPSWPSKGEIKFEDVVMPYLPGKPPVLKGISFSIHEGEKIGVVGRTGAGKSSLIVAMYRLAEISHGRIHVDNVDCATIKLNSLRSKMAIIPQEPVMFQGTIRTNLDPFHEKGDKELMDVLTKCLLGPMLASNPDGLDAKVEFMGKNFSLGTQQLLCLARAMLNPSRVLLLDEATAALDSDTNTAVQHVLKEHFYDRTIFTIAHRLDTIIDADRILVMDSGVVAEFAPPDTLLNDPESIFYELCMNSGKAQFDVLVARARANAVVKAGC
jgi:ATP-binding cassette, subfamily C (CFTR/MRP), member 1